MDGGAARVAERRLVGDERLDGVGRLLAHVVAEPNEFARAAAGKVQARSRRPTGAVSCRIRPEAVSTEQVATRRARSLPAWSSGGAIMAGEDVGSDDQPPPGSMSSAWVRLVEGTQALEKPWALEDVGRIGPLAHRATRGGSRRTTSLLIAASRAAAKRSA